MKEMLLVAPESSGMAAVELYRDQSTGQPTGLGQGLPFIMQVGESARPGCMAARSTKDVRGEVIRVIT